MEFGRSHVWKLMGGPGALQALTVNKAECDLTLTCNIWFCELGIPEEMS